MANRKISRKLKGKVLMSCVMLAYLYSLKMVALTEIEHRLQVCENNWVRRIASMKWVYKRRMDELREEIGVQMSLTARVVKCRLRWAGHLVRMEEEGKAKRAEKLRDQGRRKRCRPHFRWEDCVTRDISKLGVVGEWREFAEDGGTW